VNEEDLPRSYTEFHGGKDFLNQNFVNTVVNSCFLYISY